jgi:hypothetical protein
MDVPAGDGIADAKETVAALRVADEGLGAA